MSNSFHVLSHAVTTSSFECLVLFNNHLVQFILTEENLHSSPVLLKKLRQGCDFLSLERLDCEHGLSYACDCDSDSASDSGSDCDSNYNLSPAPSNAHITPDHQPENFYHDFLTWVRCAAEPFLTERIPHHTPSATPTLADFLFPETTVCIFHAVGDQLVPLSIASQPSTPSPSQAIWSQHFPIIAPSDVLVHADPDDDMAVTDVRFVPAFVSRASDPKTTLYFKATPLGAETELAAYTAIRHANLHAASHVRIPQLVAVVQNECGERVLGLIYEDVQSFATLGEIHIPTTNASWIDRWIKQVSDTVAALHAAGIVWGNASLDNVSIDAQHNAWISNFGDDLRAGDDDDDDDMTLSHSEAIESDRYALLELAEEMGTSLPVPQEV